MAEDGAVLFNLGCQRVEELVWCHVQPLMGGPKGYVSAEYLVPAIGPDGTVPRGTDNSARRARKGDFDAQDVVPCAQERGQALGVCSAQVARSGGGDATVVVTFPNGFARPFYFLHGHFVSANATMSGVGTDTDWRLKDGLHVLRVDDQQYVIRDDLLVDQSPKSR